MNKILVAYESHTGNTRKVAEAISEALEGEKDLRPLEQARSVGEYDLVFVGFPVQMHSVPYPAETFLKSIPPGKKIALFCTHGALPGHRLSRQAIEYAVVLAARARVLGTYSCRGRVSLSALEILSKSPEHLEWTGMASSADTHPDATDLAEAKVFARQMQLLSDQTGR